MCATAANSAQISSKYQAPSGVCRFCGRSGKHCVWADPRRTVCNHPQCVERMRMAGDSAMFRIRNPRFICGGWKSQKRALCLGCWVALPDELAASMEAPLDKGFGCYLAEVVAYFHDQRKAAETRVSQTGRTR
jgi:hypothetical protein